MAGEPILVVDDNPVNLKLAHVLLATEGYDVRTAADATEALALLERFQPRLILMDIQLPGIDGLELTRRLKADPRTRDVVILALTAFAMKGDEEKARAAGCDGYIPKPMDTRALPGVVARYLAAARTAEGKRSPGRTVLVVEDNPTTRKVVRLTLETAGYRVEDAPDGRTALERVAAGGVNLLLQDLLLPDMDGFDLLARLRALPEGKDVPILAFSGLTSKLDDAQARSVGFDGYLVKPVAPTALIEAVRQRLPLPPEAAQNRGLGRHVLIADDDPVHLSLLRLRLGELGFRVSAFTSGPDALESIRRTPPDAVICDVLVPGLDGFGLCFTMRKDPALAGIAVILVFPVPLEDADRALARKVGASAVVVGAGERSELLEALFETLAAGPPPVPADSFELLEAERTLRLIRHLERQVSAGVALAHRSTLQAAELAILAGIAEALMRAQDLEKVMTEVIARCLEAGDMSAGALFIGQPDGSVRLRAQNKFTPEQVAELPTLFGHEGVLARARAGGVVELSPSRGAFEDAEVVAEILARLAARTALIVPVAWGEVRYGVLLVTSKVKDLTEPEAVHFVRTVAGQIGQAIALARAFGQAQEAIRVRDEFLSIASHELKTPITSLQLEVQSLIRRAPKPGEDPIASEELVPRLRNVERHVHRVTRLIDELLDLSRLSAGPLRLDREEVDLGALTREVLARFEQEIQRSRSEIRLVAPGGMTGTWDRLRVDQVVTNLLSNALKYGRGKPIDVTVEADEKTARLVVRDHGIGIAPDSHARIFERFERATSARHYGGFGLGLWIVRKILDALGGAVTLESEVDQGSTFRVSLPRKPAG